MTDTPFPNPLPGKEVTIEQCIVFAAYVFALREACRVIVNLSPEYTFEDLLTRFVGEAVIACTPMRWEPS